ncbi:hypothetical protein PQQ62_33920, partial [Caballeronia grimmiae]
PSFGIFLPPNFLHTSRHITSLKLARRVTLSRHVALQQWVLLEASRAVETLCERPGLIIIDGQ